MITESDETQPPESAQTRPPEDLGVLRRRHPIDCFDRRVLFCEYAAVRAGLRVTDFEVDEDTGAYKGALPTDTEIRGHVYFLDGQLVTSPSMTGFLKNFFPETFDAQFHANRIATGTRIFTDKLYAYYRFARDSVETLWLGADLPFEQLERAYETDPNSPAGQSSAFAEFRAVHDPAVRAALIKSWEDNGRLQSGRGKEMHRSIELFYNMNPRIGPRFETKEMGFFFNFHREWVEKRGLVIYRTELSLCYFAIRLCGMIDAMFVYADDLAASKPDPVTGKPGKPIRRCVLVDWKRAKDLQFRSFRGNEYANEPFAHLQLCDGSKYYAQLNGYKCVTERYTDIRVESMHIAVFHPDEDDFVVHDVPDLQVQFKQCVARAAEKQAAEKPAKLATQAPAKPAIATKRRAAGSAPLVKRPASAALVRRK